MTRARHASMLRRLITVVTHSALRLIISTRPFAAVTRSHFRGCNSAASTARARSPCDMVRMQLALVALQLVGGAALLAGGARPPLERRAQRAPRAAVLCGLFDAMGSETAWSTTAWSTRSRTAQAGQPPLQPVCSGAPPRQWCSVNTLVPAQRRRPHGPLDPTARLSLQVRLQRIRSACSGTT